MLYKINNITIYNKITQLNEKYRYIYNQQVIKLFIIKSVITYLNYKKCNKFYITIINS